MSKTILVAALFASALAAGCSLPAPKDFIGYVDEQGMAQYQINESHVASPNVQVSREANGVLRGWVSGATLEMRVDGSSIKGFRGGELIDLHVSREGKAVVARGIYGGGLASMSVCAPDADAAAPEGLPELSGKQTACYAGDSVTIGKMFDKLGDADTMAMLVAVYAH